MSEHDAMEELVEGIAERMFGDVDEYTRAIARASVNDVLSAVRDGRLDEELGVVGRYRCSDEAVVLFEYLEKWAADMYNEDADDFIALRPLTGTGKEEEKNADSAGQRD